MARAIHPSHGITRRTATRAARILIAIALVLAGPGGVRTAGAEESFAGRLLVATPAMPDPRFAETVIYLVAHDREGAMGFIVNRPSAEVPFARLYEDHGFPDDAPSGSAARVHYGGPVGRGQAFVLHSAETAYAHTRVVEDGFAVTSDPKILHDIAEGSGPLHSLIILGYAGWGPGQLDREISQGGWDPVSADEELVFGEDHATKWDRARRRVGVEL